MEDKLNKTTKKLQCLVIERKTPTVVIKQGSIKNTSRRSSGSSYSGDSYSSSEDD